MKAKNARLLLWNIEWAAKTSHRGQIISKLIDDCVPDLCCLQEAYQGLGPENGHWIESEDDYGYSIKRGRRKVRLWSSKPWRKIDQTGHTDLPPGRFVSGVTEVNGSPLRVIAICIPWSHAHVSTGRKNRKVWEDHRCYLINLAEILSKLGDDLPTILIGDFNQRIPKGRAPQEVYDLLLRALGKKFSVWTRDIVPGLTEKTVCHVGSCGGVGPTKTQGIPRVSEGKKLSDHDGIIADFKIL